MKRKFNFSIPPKYILAILSVACFVLIVVSFKMGDRITPIKSVVGEVMTPMQKGINKIGSAVHSKTEMMNSVKTLTKENKELQEKVDVLTADNKRLEQDTTDLAELRKLFKLKSKTPKYPMVGARVISRNPDNWNSVITIDKGSSDGMKKNMNVVAGEGLVGIIYEVGNHYSKIRLITDDLSKVTSQFLKTGDKCTTKGNLTLIDKGYIDVTRIDKKAKVEDGFEVVTSTVSSKFLPGILIGYVQDIKTDDTNMKKTAHLVPVVDFENLDTVLVITKLKEALN